MSSITKVRVPPRVRSVIDDDGAVLLDVQNGTYYSLNGLGVEVWRRLEDGMTLVQIEHAIADDFETPFHIVEQDVQRFVHTLCGKALLSVDE